MRKKLVYLTLSLAAVAGAQAGLKPAEAAKPTRCWEVCCATAPTICTTCCRTADGAEICGYLSCPDA